MKIVYLVPEVGDAASRRRLKMFTAGGAEVSYLGFSRARSEHFAGEADVEPVVLGRTSNGRFARRIVSITAAVSTMLKHRGILKDADVIVARNLDMLFLAWLALSGVRKKPALIYECLDIHRLMLGRGRASSLLRRLEKALLQQTRGLITSSPTFVERYFQPTQDYRGSVILAENRLLSSSVEASAPEPRAPWRIVWSGTLRCKRSLLALRALAAALPGRVDVAIWGQPARDVIDDFDELVAGSPGLHFFGSYSYPEDLPRVFERAHFVWAIDFYESGGNSDWLLPNRLYEGGAFGVVPMAIAGTATADWLQKREGGVILPSDIGEPLVSFFSSLDPQTYAGMHRAIQSLPRSTFIQGPDDGRQLVSELARIGGGGGQ